MSLKKIQNIWKESVHLELATQDRVKGFQHQTLEPGKSITVDESCVTEVMLRLAKKTKTRPPALLIEDVVEESPAEEVKNPEEPTPSVPETEDVKLDGLTCEICNEVLPSKRKLKAHMKDHEEAMLAGEPITDAG